MPIKMLCLIHVYQDVVRLMYAYQDVVFDPGVSGCRD